MTPALLLAAALAVPAPGPLYTASMSAQMPGFSMATPGHLAAERARDAWWVGGSMLGDLITTEIGLHRCPSCREGNPLMVKRPLRLGLKAVGFYSFMRHNATLRRLGKDRAANRWRWFAVGLNAALMLNNTVHIARGR